MRMLTDTRRRIWPVIVAAAVTVGLSACASNEKLAQSWQNYCTNIGGYTPGTADFEQCVWRLYQDEMRRRQAMGAAFQRAGTQMMQQSSPPPATTHSQMRCTNRQTGNGLETTCNIE
jgi:hypothetical protein